MLPIRPNNKPIASHLLATTLLLSSILSSFLFETKFNTSTFYFVDAQQATFNLKPYIRLPKTPVVFERFEDNSCAIAENSVGNELSPIDPNGKYTLFRRKLLRFSVVIENQGPDDLVVGKPSCGKNITAEEEEANEEIDGDGDGDETTADVATADEATADEDGETTADEEEKEEEPCIWEWGECHGHYHFINFTHYELLDSTNSKIRVTGRKQAFCLMDIEDLSGNEEQGRGHYTCRNQGISAGWADVYGHWLEGQWLDVTRVRPGNYTLCVQVDYGNFFAETNEEDNRVCRPVTIPKRVGKGLEPNRRRCRAEGGNCEAGGDSECCHGSCIENNNRHRCDSGLDCLSESMRCKWDGQCCDDMRCRRQDGRGPKVCN